MSRVPRRAPSLLPVLFACTVAGCGLLFTTGPPAGHEQMRSFHCTTESTAPVLDVMFGLANLAGTLIIAGDPQTYGYEDSSAPLASGFVWTVVLGISAGVGFDRVSKCRAAREALAARRNQVVGPGGEVLNQPADSLAVSPAVDTIQVGQMVQLTAAAFASGRAVATGSVRWSSSNEAVAWVVKPSGLVTALAPGTVVVAVARDGLVATAKVVVTPPR